MTQQQTNNVFDLTAIPTTETKGKKASTSLPEQVKGFLGACLAAKRRISYSAWHNLCLELGLTAKNAEKVVTASIRHISQLPVDLQRLICKGNGGYDAKAMAAWSTGMPADLQSWSRLDDNKVLEAFNAWKAHVEQTAKQAG